MVWNFDKIGWPKHNLIRYNNPTDNGLSVKPERGKCKAENKL